MLWLIVNVCCWQDLEETLLWLSAPLSFYIPPGNPVLHSAEKIDVLAWALLPSDLTGSVYSLVSVALLMFHCCVVENHSMLCALAPLAPSEKCAPACAPPVSKCAPALAPAHWGPVGARSAHAPARDRASAAARSAFAPTRVASSEVPYYAVVGVSLALVLAPSVVSVYSDGVSVVRWPCEVACFEPCSSAVSVVGVQWLDSNAC